MPGWEAPLRAIASRNDVGQPVWLLTDLSRKALPTAKARTLYGRRWQVELYSKRLKSLLDLDELPTRDGPTARPWIWTKLILASLAALTCLRAFSPWEAPSEASGPQPLANGRHRDHRTFQSPHGAASTPVDSKHQRQ
jgi:hypothetical protein